jgi:penicillin G amidase
LYRLSHPRVSRIETFHVRFGADVMHAYSNDGRRFVVDNMYGVDWSAMNDPTPAVIAFDALDRAHSMHDALDALRRYNGPPQNFVLADVAGNAAYILAGPVPNDPSWGLQVHAAAEPHFAEVDRRKLPQVSPSRNAVVFTANNRVYGSGYGLRLSPSFEPPYRAARIAKLLSLKTQFSPADFVSMQADTFSIPEFRIARAVVNATRASSRDEKTQRALAELHAWDGRFDSSSRGAALAWRLRQVAVSRFDEVLTGKDAPDYHTVANNADLSLFMRALHDRPNMSYAGGWDGFLNDALSATLQSADANALLDETWGDFNRTPVRHPLAKLGLAFLNGITLPGDGDSYALHVQTDGHAQSFRAVWDVGNWDAGTIAIPSGESGQPGSGHYTDLTDDWIANRAVQLPYSDAAVKAATVQTLTITP